LKLKFQTVAEQRKTLGGYFILPHLVYSHTACNAHSLHPNFTLFSPLIPAK